MRRNKRKTVWAYLDGKKLVDVTQAALDNNMMVDDMKKLLIWLTARRAFERIQPKILLWNPVSAAFTCHCLALLFSIL